MMLEITVVSLGPGDPSLLTLEAADALRCAGKLVLRTGRHGVSAWLDKQNVQYDTFDALYDDFWDFDELHAEMAKRLWNMAQETPVTYAVMDAASDGSVAALSAAKPADGSIRRIAGLTGADVCMATLPHTSDGAGLRILPAIDCTKAAYDPATPLMITEIDDRILAGETKLWLSEMYNDEMEIIFFPPSEKSQRKPVTIELADLDRQKKYDHTCCAYIPAAPFRTRRRFCMADLEEIVATLRGPGGCPWDREQTHETLRNTLLEEAYEAAGAIDEKDPDHLFDELGDVLLHIVMHADIAKSHGTFTLGDVYTAICEKMIYRHEHIFGDKKLDTTAAVLDNWDKLKQQEKGLRTQASVLADVSRALPALWRAAKVQKKAAKVGFDWDNPTDALPKVHEEADEVLAELDAKRDPAEELGDLLFSCVNVARLCGCDPEMLLTTATDKFVTRFTAMENLIISDGKALEGLTLDEMDVYWNRVKTAQQG